jgi:hypothetical protein
MGSYGTHIQEDTLGKFMTVVVRPSTGKPRKKSAPSLEQEITDAFRRMIPEAEVEIKERIKKATIKVEVPKD